MILKNAQNPITIMQIGNKEQLYTTCELRHLKLVRSEEIKMQGFAKTKFEHDMNNSF